MPGKIVLVSGGFDPVHEGHLDLLEAAFERGRVYVALNSDAWLIRKKGYAFQKWDVRARIIHLIEFVHQVHPVDDADGTVCDAIRRIGPAYFANGGDRTEAEPREAALCHSLGIKQLFNVGGGKVQSSSQLVERIRK